MHLYINDTIIKKHFFLRHQKFQKRFSITYKHLKNIFLKKKKKQKCPQHVPTKLAKP